MILYDKDIDNITDLVNDKIYLENLILDLKLFTKLTD
jgi:hypothetical protein